MRFRWVVRVVAAMLALAAATVVPPVYFGISPDAKPGMSDPRTAICGT